MVVRVAAIIAMTDHQDCFVCGQARTILTPSIQFKPVAQHMVAGVYKPDPGYQSYKGILHGGIVSTLLDAAMNQCLLADHIRAMTARLNVRFLAPVLVSKPVIITGQLKRQQHKLYFLESWLSLNNQVLAQANAVFMKP